MIPDPIIAYLGTFLTVLAFVHRRALMQFMDDLGDGNVERLIREEQRVTEARDALARMNGRRV